MHYPKPPLPYIDENSMPKLLKSRVRVEIVRDYHDYPKYTCEYCKGKVYTSQKYCGKCGLELDWENILIKEIDIGVSITIGVLLAFFPFLLWMFSIMK